jgi:uncharacterized membrane protein
MDIEEFSVNVLSRVLHILAAIILFGGAFYARMVLIPSASSLPDSEHETLREAVRRRWNRYLHPAIAILIITGFYNYLAVAAPVHRAAGDKQYHMWMGIKILLAFVIFFFASALAGRMPAFAGIRKNAKCWLAVNLALATVVVVIAGFLKIRGTP